MKCYAHVLTLFYLLAFGAAPVELEEVVLHDEPGAIYKLPFQVVQHAACEIHDETADGAYKMVVMLGRLSEEVAAGVALAVHLAYETHVGQHLERAIYGDKSHVGVFAVGSLIKLGRGDVVIAFSDGVYHSATLGGQLVALLL
jgi:hypothetical protein